MTEGGGVERRAGILEMAIGPCPVGGFGQCSESSVTGNNSPGLPGGSRGTGTDQGTSLHFHSNPSGQRTLSNEDG